jgi:Domain of unknown function (DUF4260)
MQNSGVVTGMPKILLQAEGAIVLIAASFAYSQMHQSWLLFAILFFVPDIFMFGYLKNNRLGAIAYNLGHTYLVPATVLILSWLWVAQIASSIAIIWIAHIGFDRAIGYGLKYATGFKDSHLSGM